MGTCVWVCARSHTLEGGSTAGHSAGMPVKEQLSGIDPFHPGDELWLSAWCNKHSYLLSYLSHPQYCLLRLSQY